MSPPTPDTTPIPVAVARGDGIGPEIVDATLRILAASGANLDVRPIVVGHAAVEAGASSVIPEAAWQTIRETKVLLKGPLATPPGEGHTSATVALRSALGLYANVRHVRALSPFVASAHPAMDVVIVRENEEDLYTGIEHRQTQEVAQTLKLVSRPGSERIVRYAFAYARAHGRSKVTCMVKDAIMKLTDGVFHREFDRVAREYPDLEAEVMIVDIGTARLAATPETFDVIVTLNLYGDILSDVGALISGSVGLAGSANVGEHAAMFEAVHGSAPDIAGRGIANPSGLLSAATDLLLHVGRFEIAERVRNAWLATLEDGVHTADVFRPDRSAAQVGTDDFADAVIERLGREPTHLRPVRYRGHVPHVHLTSPASQARALVGADVFVMWDEHARDPDRLGPRVEDAIAGRGLTLVGITNRGAKVYPNGLPETYRTDHWRCRLLDADRGATTVPVVLDVVRALHDAGFDVIKTEHLYAFDGVPGFSPI